jgi:CRP-like cAMP-binding protein
MSNEYDHDEIVRILRKKHKSPTEVELLEKRFEKVNFFKDSRCKLDTESYHKLLKTLSYEKVPGNQLLFRQGDPGAKFFIILKGKVSVVLNRSAKEVVKNTVNERRQILRVLNEFHPDLMQLKISSTSYVCLLNGLKSLIFDEDSSPLKVGSSRKFDSSFRIDTLTQLDTPDPMDSLMNRPLLAPEEVFFRAGALVPPALASLVGSQSKIGGVSSSGKSRFTPGMMQCVSIGDLPDSEIPPLKKSRPFMKLSWWVIKFWKVKLQTEQEFRKEVPEVA